MTDGSSALTGVGGGRKGLEYSPLGGIGINGTPLALGGLAGGLAGMLQGSKPSQNGKLDQPQPNQNLLDAYNAIGSVPGAGQSPALGLGGADAASGAAGAAGAGGLSAALGKASPYIMGAEILNQLLTKPGVKMGGGGF